MPHDEDAYGRSMRYRELPPDRMPQYEDEIIAGKVSNAVISFNSNQILKQTHSFDHVAETYSSNA